MNFDYSLGLFFHSLTNYPIVAKCAVFCAEYLPYVVVAILLGIVVYALHTQKNYNFFLLTVTSLVVARFCALPLIRLIVRRPRPFVFNPEFTPLVSASGFSFPSGHATAFFALATAVYFWNKKMGYVFYVFATLIAFGRVFVGVHYPLDVLGGAVLGIGLAWFVAKFIPIKN